MPIREIIFDDVSRFTDCGNLDKNIYFVSPDKDVFRRLKFEILIKIFI